MSDSAQYKQPENELKKRTSYVLNIMGNKPGMKNRLKRSGLTIDSAAYIVAITLIAKERHDKIIALSTKAKKQKKIAGRNLQSEIKKIEDVFGKPFKEIKPDSRKEVFFEQHKARPYLNAAIEKTLFDEKKTHELGKTRPKQKYFDRFCSAFRALFALSGKSPNSRLIADIANLFDLTDSPQTSETIRTRIQRLPWKSPYSKSP